MCVGEVGGLQRRRPARGREIAGRRFDPPGEQEGDGPVARRRGRSPTASSAARIRCAPRLSPRTTHAQPKPFTMSSASCGSCAALHASAASMFARSVRATARNSTLLATPHPSGRRGGEVGEPARVRCRRAGSDQPGFGGGLERERADAVEQAVAEGERGVLVVDDDQRAGREPSDDVDRRRRRHVEPGVEHELDRGQRRAAGERGQRPQAALVVGEQQLVAPPDRRLQRAPAFGLACSRDPAAPRSGRRAGG